MVLRQPFGVRVLNSENASRLLLSGGFDRSGVPLLEKAFDQVLDGDVVLDLGELTFMDGAAWLAVMENRERVQDSGRRMWILNAVGDVRQIFARTETEHLLAESAMSR
jgi:anti-anti-sigma factor